ncbi:L,D-transpeptidase family protein [Sphingomonas sp.]|uniref:L,D-transpeptidase family protein n=1 Tax=Sphingomonas sp. TaxID=28214 RepID=UPI003B002F61
MRLAGSAFLLLTSAALTAQTPPPKPPAPPAAQGPAAAPVAAPTPSTTPPVDPKIMQVQVVLDLLGFGPGVIDGKQGQSLKLALSGFQTANDLPSSGTVDPATAAALQRFGATQPVREIVLTPPDLAGPFVGPIPHGEDEQAKLPTLGYQNALEMLAERYHTTPATLIALNSPDTKLVPGTKLRVPNVVTPDRAYPPQAKPEWKATLAGLNVSSKQPQADHIVVSKAKKSLSVYDAQQKLVAQFPVTTGSTHDPLPLGDWKIYGADTNPKFHYNPKLFWDAKAGDQKAMLPPGPNGPVGVVWLDLSKEHYGIHGTPEPQNIGRTASHGCVRMTNWDAARLALMVKPGTKAIFEE